MRLMKLWRAGVDVRGWLFRAALALLLAVSVAFMWYMAARLAPVIRSGNMAFSDFFAHWSYAKFAFTHPGPAIYDHDAMFAFQRGLFDGQLKSQPFVYPPPYLFLVAPLAAFDIWTAAVLWGIASVAAFTLAVCGGRWQGWIVALCVLGPATTLCLGYGQNGLLLAALLVGGLRLLPARPGWGGVLLALACVKPQMAVLLPVALLAGRQWRAIGAAMVTGLLLIVASTLWIGPLAWVDWYVSLLAQGDYAATWISAYRQPTVTGVLSLFGVARATGLVVQAGVSVLIVLGVAATWRRGPTPEAACVLLAGVLLATPYGFVYDLPVVTAACLGLLAGRRALPWPEAAVAGAVLILPALLFLTSRFFWTGPPVQAALFALCLVRARERSNQVYQPASTTTLC